MDEPVVKISTGQLLGDVGTDRNGKQFYKFLGIPYAKPPVGDLRFKAPLTAESWSDIRDAKKEGSCCLSKNLWLGTTVGTENCLFVNVYTKQILDTSPVKPVLVFIHGGSFTFGSGNADFLGPEFLMTEDVVLVTLNYRLGALGFLSLEDPSLGVLGNAGLKDQVLALKWVQQNIKYFGGDPNNVTVFGVSAGSAAVHYLVLSPKTKGLFHKAILQGGCALNCWAQGRPFARELANNLGYNGTDEKEFLEILRKAPAEKILEAQSCVNDALIANNRRAFAPIIEKTSPEAFIDKDPAEIIATGNYNQVPLIFGYNDKEGMLIELSKNDPNFKIDDLEQSIPWDLEIQIGSDASKALVEKLKNFYLKGSDATDDMYMLQSDVLTVIGILASAKTHAATSSAPVYLYRTTVDTELNLFKKVFQMADRKGVCHGDDMGYLFKTIFTPQIKPGSIEDTSVNRFVKLWTNFAKFGNPTPNNELVVEWKPLTKNETNFLDIGQELTLHKDPETDRVALWKEIYKQNLKASINKLG